MTEGTSNRQIIIKIKQSPRSTAYSCFVTFTEQAITKPNITNVKLETAVILAEYWIRKKIPKARVGFPGSSIPKEPTTTDVFLHKKPTWWL